MKEIIHTSARLLVLSTFVFAAASCQKPADRPATEVPGAFSLADIGEITTDVEKKASEAAESAEANPTNTSPAPKKIERVVYVSDVNSTASDNVKKLDAEGLSSKKIAGAVDAIVKKVIIEKNKTELTNHLKTGAIALVVLKDEIKIMAVTGDLHWNGSNMNTLKSLAYMKALSARERATDAAQNSAMNSKVAQLAKQQPADVAASEKVNYGLNELTSIKIKSMGKLQNARTVYGEKRSVMEIVPTSLAEATHIVLGDEVGAAASEEAPAAQ